MSDSKKYWVGFNLVKGIGPARIRTLLAHFGNLKDAWEATALELNAIGLGARPVETLLQVRREVDLDEVWRRISSQEIGVITWEDENYPRRLAEIDQPPPVLYVRGEILPEDEWAVAVVGTRRITAYGRQVAEEIGAALGSNGVTVVSGLARGVDAVAHKAALKSGGRTLAVLGSGVDRIYPPEHRRLAGEVIRQGAVISDYALGTPPDGVNFPPRNRIISGLSIAVVIVEAGERSGALITANFAADQGRDVFAVPGNIHAPQSRGPNRLIQNGARPLLSPKEILESLDLTLIHEFRAARAELPVDTTEAGLLRLLSQVPMHVDEIQAESEMPVEQVTALLTMMELKGLVRQVGGMNYISVRELPDKYDLDGKASD